MSEVLRNPWILRSVLDDLSNDITKQSGLNHIHRTPQLAQIIQFVKGSGEGTHILGHVSDKFHYIVSFFSDQSLGRFVSRHPNWSIKEIQGAIIRILEFRFVKVSCSGDAEVGNSVVLVIEDFEHVGSDGSPVFGDPRYVSCNPAVRTALQRPAPPSPSKKELSSLLDNSFTRSLDPTDLLFLESTCTQTLQRQSQSFPQVISDQDWRIPAEQVKILERIELIKLAAYEYSDVELSEEEEVEEEVNNYKKPRERVTFPETQPSTDLELINTQVPVTQVPMTQAPMTQAPMTQVPMTQNTMTASSGKQTQYSYSNVMFPETQVPSSSSVLLDETQKTPLKMSKTRSGPVKYSPSPFAVEPAMNSIPLNEVPSSPINSPVKLTRKQPETVKEPPLKQQPILEYPDYSSW